MRPMLVQYDAPGFGVGEVWLDDRGRVFHAELPRPKRTGPAPGAERVSRERVGSATGEAASGVATDLSRPKRTGPAPGAGHALAGRLEAFFAGEPDDFRDVRLRLPDGFHGACARVLRTIPRGEVVTYGELAALAGRPGAARAAGTFCARCDLSPFVPTHRVVAAGGLGSYGDLGVGYKRRLLDLEGVRL